jgi:hypothetical protein
VTRWARPCIVCRLALFEPGHWKIGRKNGFNMNMPATRDNWLQNTMQILSREGFVISEHVRHSSGTVRAVARRTRWELTKFGFSETFFVFNEFETISADTFRRFSSDAFAIAKQSKTIPLPCGLFESVWCFSVAITKHVDDAAVNSVRNDAPTKHWAAAEIPVIFNQGDGRLYYFEKTPIWGVAYYPGFRSQINRHLGHGAVA